MTPSEPTTVPAGDEDAAGPLALVGGAEWREGCSFDRELWEASGRAEVVVLPTAAAYEHPERAVATAAEWFATFGATVRGLMILNRPDAEEASAAEVIANARFLYLSGGSPLHLRSVLKDSPAWAALESAWRSGAVLAGSSAGAMVLGDPMVDPRGGALTLGLGLLPGLAVLPHRNRLSPEKSHRSMRLATGGVTIAAVDEATALIRSPGGAWRVEGAGQVELRGEGAAAVTLESLAALRPHAAGEAGATSTVSS